MVFKTIKQYTYEIICKLGLRPVSTALISLKLLEIDYGHFESSKIWQSVDGKKNPIPWFSYPAVEYLKSLNLSKMSVFEYGSGNSTLFWSKHATKVVSVDNNPIWFNSTLKKLEGHKNFQLILENDKNKYINAINKNKTQYDIIVIDGEHRYECSQRSIRKLKRGGLIILDNSDWFPKINKYLRGQDLIQIDFTGFGPINPYTSTTSIFINRKFQPKITDKIKHPGSIKPD